MIKKLLMLTILFPLFFVSCSEKKGAVKSIAVFIPGILSDSPIYSMLADGAVAAVDEFNAGKDDEQKASVSILEAGTNQAEWGAKITALAAGEKYSLIISSNPSLPEIVQPICCQFPHQKFILLDAHFEGDTNIATVRYNQREQAFLSGYISALMSKTNKIGLIAAQHYPVMDNVILPAYTEGAKAAASSATVDYRIVGNWYDASKGSELSRAMFNSGVDVILPICGGASQGVISSAKEQGFYIAWFDSNGFSKASGNVISSAVLRQDVLARELTLSYLKDETEWGTARTVGLSDGYVEFVQDDPLYIETVPKSVRDKMASLIESIRTGELNLMQND